jgi:pimeloyl-ACP methyl ester carboxylesterase
MRRRQFCLAIAAGGASISTLGSAGATSSGAEAAENPREKPVAGYVSTRGHFDVRCGTDFLASEHTETDYELERTIPGWNGDAPDELVVMVHGFKNDEASSVETFRQAAAAFEANGYDGPVVGFSWDADGTTYQWWPIDDVATRNGPKLALFLLDYATLSPDTTVHLVGHSLGARVVLEAMQALHDWDFEATIDTVDLLGAAVSDRSIVIGESWLADPYGPALEARAGDVNNYWQADDEVLDSYYQWAEWEAALGSHGVAGTPPENYADHRVDYVDEHLSYYYADGGCVGAVTEKW